MARVCLCKDPVGTPQVGDLITKRQRCFVTCGYPWVGSMDNSEWPLNIKIPPNPRIVVIKRVEAASSDSLNVKESVEITKDPTGLVSSHRSDSIFEWNEGSESKLEWWC